MRVSGGDLCTKCRSTDRAGRRDQVLLPLPKKAPIFRCFFPLFTAIYGDFTCFSHIDKITAHGLFRTPLFHFYTVFLFSLCHTIHPIRLVHHQKSINHNSNQFVISYYIKPLLYLINLFILCVNSYMQI